MAALRYGRSTCRTTWSMAASLTLAARPGGSAAKNHLIASAPCRSISGSGSIRLPCLALSRRPCASCVPLDRIAARNGGLPSTIAPTAIKA